MQNKPETTKIGECEVCPATDIEISVHYGNLWMCADCWKKEQTLKAENQKPENVEARVHSTKLNPTTPIDSKLIEMAKAVDNAAHVRTDMFNSETVSIIDIKNAIDADDSITNKPGKLAEILFERFNKHTALVFDLGEQLMEANARQKAVHVYMNQLANSLRAEEREKYRITDISYKPQAPKTPTVKKISTTGTTKKAPKLDKAELRKYAKELGVSEFTLQQVVVSKGVTVAEAAESIKKFIEAAKAQ